MPMGVNTSYRDDGDDVLHKKHKKKRVPRLV